MTMDASQARGAAVDEVLLGDAGDSRCQLHAGAGHDSGAAGAEWLRKIDDGLAVDRAARALGRSDLVRWSQHCRSPGRVQGPSRLRTRGSPPLYVPVRA